MSEDSKAIEEITSAISKKLIAWLGGVAAAVIVALSGGIAIEYARVQRIDERLSQHSTEIERLDRRLDGAMDVRRELSSLKAVVETNQRSIEGRLVRIENALDQRERERQ